jgi:hypothetical protein
MSFKVDPKNTQIIPRDLLQDARAKKAGAGDKPKYMRAMEKPTLMATPGLAKTAPRPGGRTGELPKFQQRALELLSMIKAGGPNARNAAAEALAAAASYSMRRSKGSRRRGSELLDAVSEEDDELSELAMGLRHVLLAEAYLQEASGEATLRAVRALVGMLDQDEIDTKLAEVRARFSSNGGADGDKS